MTEIELNAELFRALGEIAGDETLMTKAVKYIKKLAAKKEDPTLMTKEEFFAKVDKAMEEAKQGKVKRMLPNESLEEFIKRVRI